MAQPEMKFEYRPDVDGLRAVAVGLVLLFHAGLGFTGGYIGVDVFFVISGYLITGLILKGLDQNKFDLKNFWVRRIRRIVPAVSAMVCVVLVVGFFTLLPNDFEELGMAAVSQQLMASNIFFWLNTDYFDGPAELKPLLHTWSLAVEEQFYLFYPFLLVCLHRFGRRLTLLTLLTIGVFSLGGSQYGVNHHPTATFFLLPTRAWELIIGGLIWFMPQPRQINSFFLSLTSWISLAAIIGSGWYYSAMTPFPGLTAMVPCLATTLLIYANSNHQTSTARLLSSRPFIHVGLVSYSLYLWHWPVLAYARYWIGDSLSSTVGVLAILISYGLALASWKYIEQPFRKPGQNSSAFKVFVVAGVSAVGLIAIGMSVYLTKGFVERFPEEIRSVLEIKSTGSTVGRKRIVQQDVPILGKVSGKNEPPEFILWGDSHAMALLESFDDAAKDIGMHGVYVTRSATIPIPNLWRPFYKGKAKEALKWNQSVLELISKKEIRNVILVSRWAVNIEGRPTGKLDTLVAQGSDSVSNPESARTAFRQSLSQLLDVLEENEVNVWIMKQVPLQEFDPQRAIVRSLYFQSPLPKGVSKEDHENRQKNANQIIDECIKGRSRVFAVDLSEKFYENGPLSIVGETKGSYYKDQSHLSPLGAQVLVRPKIEMVLRKIQQEVKASKNHSK